MLRNAKFLTMARSMTTHAECGLSATLEAHAKGLVNSLEVGCASSVVPVMREKLLQKREVHGDTHPSTIATINSLAGLLLLDGRHEEAQPLIRESITASRLYVH